MCTVEFDEAKSSLSSLVEAIELGKALEITITRHGHPVAKLVPMDPIPIGHRIGVAKGKFHVPETIDRYNEDIGKAFSKK
ncbi:prevent-host-death protein [Pollutimonas nitritireducens]|uniref:Antitoxin n=1 Tax=Pollutimonas nitritireducens TaxID=2045209 RepID=A0A2N4UAI9_9BURK|nr:type II toxin-antitoxin system prevent-host-death family antitoxin [Pollutimonas nitritireducens]PLC52034.1 prevent-host-death protein [Pollutimonas nitritireducens]